MSENITNLAEYRDDKKGHWSGASVRQTTRHKIAVEFAAIADAPGAKEAGHPGMETNFYWMMHDDFCSVSHRRGFADLDIQDMCGIASWALIVMRKIRGGTAAQKRAMPGWRDRLKAVKKLELAAFAAVLDTPSTTYVGVMAKMRLALAYAQNKNPNKAWDMEWSAGGDQSDVYCRQFDAR